MGKTRKKMLSQAWKNLNHKEEFRGATSMKEKMDMRDTLTDSSNYSIIFSSFI